jgi:hypothetical protein
VYESKSIYRVCKTLFETCSALKNAEAQINERSTRLLSNCLQMKTQLEIYRQIGDQLDEQCQIVQSEILEVLVLTIKLCRRQTQRSCSKAVFRAFLKQSAWKVPSQTGKSKLGNKEEQLGQGY